MRSSHCQAILTVGLLALGAAATAGTSGKLRAEIRTTSYGVAHIVAPDIASAGFGEGYAFAQTDLCEIAQRWVTVNAQRSRYFGAEDSVPTFREGDGSAPTNLESDFFWQWVLDTDIVGRRLRQPPPRGPSAEVREMIRGYVAGYNLYLARTGVDKLPDSRCRGAAWVRPITEKDVYLRSLHASMFATSVQLVREFVAAAPPQHDARTSLPSSTPEIREGLTRALADSGERTGSNMIALGKDATDNGRGMLFANPHWYWNGPERFFESQLTVPGKLNVYGVAMLGMPVIVIGETEHAAWSHTVSTPAHFTFYELKLVPNDPTSYIYDGAVHKLDARTVRVELRTADGKRVERSHTFWSTPYGLIVQDKNLPWTQKIAYALRDADVSLSWMNKEMALNHAQSTADIQAAGRRYLGIPWVNTIAADSDGHAMYADDTGVPHVSNEMLATCVPPVLGKAALGGRLFVLDGSRSSCAWGSDPDSIQPGTFGPGELPHLERSDYVTNSNDSYWTDNPHQLLQGFPRIMGQERTIRTLRTRLGLLKLERRLAGEDGLPGNRFSLASLETITMDNKVLSGELWRDAVVRECRGLPASDNAGAACEALEKWDLTENLDSQGAVLWRRFFENLAGDHLTESASAELFAIPFDPVDPIHTPSGLNTQNPRVHAALLAAIADLRNASIPLNASLRNYQNVARNDVRIPIPGGPGGAGQYNDIESGKGWTPPLGWPDVSAGSSFIMWTRFTADGPEGRSILTYSQSNNVESPFHSDQTRLFSEKRSKPILFREADIAADPNLRVSRICVNEAGRDCQR